MAQLKDMAHVKIATPRGTLVALYGNGEPDIFYAGSNGRISGLEPTGHLIFSPARLEDPLAREERMIVLYKDTQARGLERRFPWHNEPHRNPAFLYLNREGKYELSPPNVRQTYRGTFYETGGTIFLWAGERLFGRQRQHDDLITAVNYFLRMRTPDPARPSPHTTFPSAAALRRSSA